MHEEGSVLVERDRGASDGGGLRKRVGHVIRKHRSNLVGGFKFKAKRRAGSAAGGVQADCDRAWPTGVVLRLGCVRNNVHR